MNCLCSHTVFNHHPKMEREGAVRFTLGACAVQGCGCTKYVVAGRAERAKMGDVEISEDERSFAVRRWRNLQRERREMRERYGFPDE
jgi:hypothetical protein